jgi:putative NADPH-quinone reductase
MARRIVIIQGHPDAAGAHLCHALADAYAGGAAEAGHEVERVEVAALDFPWLRSKEEFDHGPLPPVLAPAQQAIGRADHLVLVFPLWLGDMPAVLKAFLEQVLRPSFAFTVHPRGLITKHLRGKSARVVVTMGAPALWYRLVFGGHGVKSLRRSILGFCGVGPVRESLLGFAENAGEARRLKWLTAMRDLGKLAR